VGGGRPQGTGYFRVMPYDGGGLEKSHRGGRDTGRLGQELDRGIEPREKETNGGSGVVGGGGGRRGWLKGRHRRGW